MVIGFALYFILLCSKYSVGQGDLKSLHCELHPVSDKWFSLGVQLQVPIETLKFIRRENLPMTERLLEMLTVWLKCTNPPPTWNILTEALESFNRNLQLYSKRVPFVSDWMQFTVQGLQVSLAYRVQHTVFVLKCI